MAQSIGFWLYFILVAAEDPRYDLNEQIFFRVYILSDWWFYAVCSEGVGYEVGRSSLIIKMVLCITNMEEW